MWNKSCEQKVTEHYLEVARWKQSLLVVQGTSAEQSDPARAAPAELFR